MLQTSFETQLKYFNHAMKAEANKYKKEKNPENEGFDGARIRDLRNTGVVLL